MNDVIKKVIGLDYELANSVVIPGNQAAYPEHAATMLLDQIRGFPRRSSKGSSIEFGRRFLPGNGGSAYVDSDHCEINTPEHLRAEDHFLHVHAGLVLARRAQHAINARLSNNRGRVEVLANNCDGHVSYGSHLNLLTTARCFDDLLYRKPHLGALLATHLVTSVLYTGQGMVGAANGSARCDFQLSQRADWFERYSGLDTMQRRPLLNLRDESHAADGLARLHIIYFDLALAPIACLLRAGTTQLVLALCEAGWVDPTIALDDPVGVASEISRDLDLLQTYCTTVRRRQMTAVEIQSAICDLAGELVASGAVDHAVPGAREIVSQWRKTLELLRQKELDGLAPRCDAWLKYLLLQRRRAKQGLSWTSPEMKMLDLRYASIDPQDSLFLSVAQANALDDWPGQEAISNATNSPPEDTRAYLRTHILRRFGAEISDMNWSWIDFRLPSQRGWFSNARLKMNDPRRFTKAECGELFDRELPLEELVSVLAAESDAEALAGLRETTPVSALHEGEGIA